MYYPFILYFNKYVFNLAAHKTAVKPLCNGFFAFTPLGSEKSRFLQLPPPHAAEKNVPKVKTNYMCRC